uniref:Ribosome-binding factor A n=2 Tax=Octactis speculum TaxID=3111310 RepID=A0A7S2DN30_9STRA|mmetsp:Transcript_50781/g.69100  ORF Transcript_50781/g.69100 Transcript_50781/m.69100 type:complete len:269 (+) Transcript_50781:57-863(+)
MRVQFSFVGVVVLVTSLAKCSHCFCPPRPLWVSSRVTSAVSTLHMSRGNAVSKGRESKRQGRVSQVIRSEIVTILRRGSMKYMKKDIGDTLRQKISIVDVHMSPDLRTAKVYVSVFGDIVDRRQAYSWLVMNSKAIKHSLAQSLSAMKTVPDLYFKETDLAAAVDVMTTIESIHAEASNLPRGVIQGLDFDFLDDDDDDDDISEGVSDGNGAEEDLDIRNEEDEEEGLDLEETVFDLPGFGGGGLVEEEEGYEIEEDVTEEYLNFHQN